MVESDSGCHVKIVVMGNGPFAVPLLEQVASSDHEVQLVVTRPDRPMGKHQVILAGPVHARAVSLGLPVLQPEDVNSAEFVAKLAELHADLFVVADFGQILSAECLAASRLGGINVHASLLPQYRGAAPVVWAINEGEKETGVSIIRMTTALDAGAVVLQKRVSISDTETAGELETRLSVLGAEAAVEALSLFASSNLCSVEQDPRLATKAPRLKKEDGRIRWGRSSFLVQAQVRAMQPWPTAFSDWHRQHGEPLRIQIMEVEVMNPSGPVDGPPGTVVAVDGQLCIATGDAGVVRVVRLKPAGKREMDAKTFLNGHRVQAGDHFA